MQLADPPATNPATNTGVHDWRSESVAQRYDAIIESTDDAVVATSLDATILSWNPGAERMHGFPAEQAIGERLSLIVPADRAGETVRLLHSASQGERVDRLQTVRARRDGTRFDVSTTVSPVREKSGRIVGALMITRDLSDPRRTSASSPAHVAAAEAKRVLEQAEHVSRIGTWVLELTGAHTMTWSKEYARVLGLAQDTPITVEYVLSLVHPDDRVMVDAAMTSAVEDHRAYEIEHRMVRPDGGVRWFHVWAEPEYDGSGRAVRVLGVAQDITERHAADETLRASERRFRLLAENARDLIFRITLLPEPQCEYVSPASLAITGFTPAELYEKPLLMTGLIAPEHIHEMEHMFHAGALSDPLDVAIRRKDGTIVWVSQHLTFVSDDSGTLIAVEGIVRDITDRKRAEQALVYVGLHDALTDLPNRVLLRERLDLARARARAEGRSVIVVALDLDDFTLINDTHGHDCGDEVLVAVAGMLSQATGGHATVARTGSDEFVIVGDDIANEADAIAFVDQIREALHQPIRTETAELFVHARIGATVDDPGATPDNLLRNADIALARAKGQRTGPGVEFFTSAMRTRTHARFALVGDLHRALARHELEIHYQPIVQLANNQVIGAEALLRWRHPTLGFVSPAEFIPLAEDTGLIVEIGAWVLNRACAQLRTVSGSDPAHARFTMSVNVSVKQLRSPGIVQTVADAVSSSGIDPRRLTIEMTESVFVDDLDTIHDVLTEFRALGVKVAVDDFGTGYSSLSYLKNLPFDTLKIDRAFIEGLGTDPYDAAIVASALSISRALGLLPVAEGVETAEQLEVLRSLGCNAAQGYYFSKPITAAELMVFVATPRER